MLRSDWLRVVFRNLRQYPEACEEAGLLLVRLDAPLYFANMQYVRDRLRKYEQRSQVHCSSHDRIPCAVCIRGSITLTSSTFVHQQLRTMQWDHARV